ncbi:MAG: diguanylate cyclase [Endomicrobium sp.]|jgi:diguanylate cyclase (GGDEF)-like protein|nr:diguanylate cyclase [Endomicrobium sp.]
MIKKINAALILINIALASYLIMKLNLPVIAYVYFIALFGLYFSKDIKEIALLCAAVSIFFTIKFMGRAPVPAALSCAFFICAAIVPYYFSMRISRVKKVYLQRNSDIKNKREEALLLHSQIYADKKRHEEEFEKIMQFYISARGLSKNINMQEYASIAGKIFSNKPGITSVNIFDRKRSKWECLYCERPFFEKQWLQYLNSNRDLLDIVRASEIETPQFCPKNESAVFLPLKMQNEILGCLTLTCEKDYAERYVLEGQIFSPQISLSVKRIKLMEEISEKARNDGLTGLYKRRYFIERLQNEIEREKRYPKGFFIMMLDIDWFKKVNDKFGHLTGDRVLVSVSKTLSDSCKFGTFAGRYGGEEFIIFVPVSTESEALDIAKEINKAIAAKKYKSGEESFRITISVGIAGFPADGDTVDELIKASDAALYEAKESGRNKVVIYKKRL